MKKTTKVKKVQIADNRDWHLIDAKEQSVGRIATQIATYLIGKNRPDYSPHDDKGANVVIINSDQLKIHPGKLKGKMYYHYTGYPGGLREKDLAGKLEQRGSDWVVEEAVRGMLPKNRLRKDRMKRLRVYRDEKHPHGDQLKK